MEDMRGLSDMKDEMRRSNRKWQRAYTQRSKGWENFQNWWNTLDLRIKLKKEKSTLKHIWVELWKTQDKEFLKVAKENR